MTKTPDQPSPHDSQTRPLRRFAQWIRGLLVTLLSLCGILALLFLDDAAGEQAAPPLGGQRLSYGLRALAGFFTGFHCVGMCGALVVSYSVGGSQSGVASYASHLYYGLGKTLSYTSIGALFGALGAIVTFTPLMRGIAAILAGVFLLLFGLSLLNVFPSLNRWRIRTPAFLMRFIGSSVKRHSHPFVIGLLNGLMIICGPLQAMYVMAAGTGSPAEGGRLLLAFGLGTLPVMLGFGVLTSTFARNLAPRLLKASGYVVMALGVIMLNRGLAMSGSGHDFHSLTARLRVPDPSENLAAAAPHRQVIRMQVNSKGFEPDHFNLIKDVPVEWVIEGKELNYCNHRIAVPSLGMEFDVSKGESRVEFTPRQVGVIAWGCWMGMIPGSFLVHEQPVATPVPGPTEALDWLERTNLRVKHWVQGLAEALSHDSP
jgi:sulfite exporter TauE/SafE